ncbi:MAG: YdcF family protein [Pseudoalteromonas sp.]|uniref:YdcF family protein n=2 Tax=unclassified Pseudoalteromonas TaxID=194690 RepID=UPI003F993232
MFELKKIIGALIMPLPLVGVLTLIFLIMALRGSKLAGTLGLLSITSLLALCTPFVGQFIVAPHNQVALHFEVKKHKSVDKIVVLGCDIIPNSALAANSQLGNCAKSRLIEGLRLAYYYPQAQLIVSGGGYGNATNSNLMRQTAISLGINPKRIKQNPAAMDTADEAKFLAPKLVDFDVALVTSASHMPRASDLFYTQGVNVIPAATDFHDFSQWPGYKQFIPNADVLLAVTRHWHEVIGSAWVAIRRWLTPEAL